MEPTLIPGLCAKMNYQVPETRTVPYLLPEAEQFAGMPHVLATGYLVGLVEWSCMQALDGHLDPSEQSVGVHVDLSHEAPTPPGSTVTIDVTVTAVEGPTVTFTVTARDDAAVVCRGQHRRAVVDWKVFQDKLAARTAAAVGTAAGS
jgi:fluoroacetyl-CoA thioesterase